MLVLITIDVKTDEKQDRIVNTLKKMGSWARISHEVWALQTTEHSIKGIRDVLGADLELEEGVFVVDMSESRWSCRGVKVPAARFLQEKQRQELGVW